MNSVSNNKERCVKCSGTGKFRPKFARAGESTDPGKCYRCDGKGWMDDKDREALRNRENASRRKKDTGRTKRRRNARSKP